MGDRGVRRPGADRLGTVGRRDMSPCDAAFQALPLHCAASHRIASHRIASHRIASHRAAPPHTYASARPRR
ncbi:hypothetical protein WS86_19700 [Burkholderia savannae]|nr:hypothetical protein WS86_19700 [Burkholderia savannae]